MRGEPPEWAVFWISFAASFAIGWFLLRPALTWAVLELLVALTWGRWIA